MISLGLAQRDGPLLPHSRIDLGYSACVRQRFKLRAIEPVHLDSTPYDALVPATHSAWTYPEISISNNLLRNVKIYEKLIQEP